MKKLFLLLMLFFFSAQSFAQSCLFNCETSPNNIVANSEGGKTVMVSPKVKPKELEIKSYENLDVTSRPKNAPSKSNTQSLWNAYKTAPECKVHPPYGEYFGYQLKKISNDDFLNNQWISPFYRYEDTYRHEITLEEDTPKPIITVKLDEIYGEQNPEVERAREFFRKAAYVARVSNSTAEVEKVKTVLLEWAKNNALKEGISVSWGRKPVDWQMMMLINSILTTTAAIGENFSAEERQILGPWLNNLIKKVAKSSWAARQDNKNYLTSYIGLIWGLMVNDLNAVQNSIDVVKFAVHDMRPDGSFPIDTQRGGMGLKYNADSFGYLLMMTSILRDTTGKDLFLYKADGRSLHNGVDFVIKSVKEPSKTNSIYAISCPSAGDRFGTIKNPSLHHVETSSYLLVYANKFPKNTNSDFVIKKYNDTFNQSNAGSNIKSKPSEVFTLHPMLISAPPEVFLLMEEEVIETSNAFDGRYSFNLFRYHDDEDWQELGNGFVEIMNGELMIDRDNSDLKTASTELYDTFSGQIDEKGNVSGSVELAYLFGKDHTEVFTLSGQIDKKIWGDSPREDFFRVYMLLVKK